MIEGTILLVGCGKMGGALLKGWFSKGLNPVDIMIVEPAGRSAVEAASDHPALVVLSDANELPTDFTPDAVVFAIKPQIVESVLPSYAHIAGSGAVFLSIVAGLSIATLETMLGDRAALVRAMPNMPAAIGRGISVLYAGNRAGPAQKRVCKVLMAAVGETAWIDDEIHMDAVTALSGSGPAYVFLMAEVLAAAGESSGLEPILAERLARATVAGAGALIDQQDLALSGLRQSVTSPGGTTEAALEILMAETGLSELMLRAVIAAAKRSKELAG